MFIVKKNLKEKRKEMKLMNDILGTARFFMRSVRSRRWFDCKCTSYTSSSGSNAGKLCSITNSSNNLGNGEIPNEHIGLRRYA